MQIPHSQKIITLNVGDMVRIISKDALDDEGPEFEACMGRIGTVISIDNVYNRYEAQYEIRFDDYTRWWYWKAQFEKI